MEDVRINILDRLNPKDKSKLTQRNIVKKFGKYNDYISMYLYDRNDKLIYRRVNQYFIYKSPKSTYRFRVFNRSISFKFLYRKKIIF